LKQFVKSFPFYIIFILLITGCTHLPSTQERLASATKLAEDAGWTSETISTSYFDLQAFIPAQRLKNNRLTVFIEGDGLAWISRSQPSSDPTPLNPVSLKLALAYESDDAVAYLGRPCQFTSHDQKRCTQKYWTSHRFSKEVIIATGEAITALKIMIGASELQLVGYSGGGAIAALVASRRDDVTRLVTFAGNLNTTAWTELHHISPLSGSLNPADAVSGLQGIQQIHFVGEHDRVTPAEIVESFNRLLPLTADSQIIIIPEADHRCCWLQVIKQMK
jgi:dienelactone hydrolase|tara:strand:+ start:3372 stop:4202 length:831 start_codon:yes stop_codon:yes gene_type:complete